MACVYGYEQFASPKRLLKSMYNRLGKYLKIPKYEKENIEEQKYDNCTEYRYGLKYQQLISDDNVGLIVRDCDDGSMFIAINFDDKDGHHHKHLDFENKKARGISKEVLDTIENMMIRW